MKIRILFLIIILLITFNITTSAKGIILANNEKIIEIFRSHTKEKIENLINDIDHYEKVIIHLGSKYVFERGSAFFYKTSQENLIYFCDKLSEKNIKVYLWFLDSFGSKNFTTLYEDYKNIIDNNYKNINQLNLKYDGIIIDLEWINLNSNFENNEKYIEIIKYLSNKFVNKEIYSFASIIDNEKENIRRGYDERNILNYLDNIIPMLYVKDGGYFIEDNQLNFYFNKNRIENLKKYYHDNNYIPAVSIEDGIILERNSHLYFIKTTNNFNYEDNVKEIYKKEKYYFKITGFKPINEFIIEKNDGITEKIRTNDRLHYFRLNNANLLKDDNYIWEYFISKEYKPE